MPSAEVTSDLEALLAAAKRDKTLGIGTSGLYRTHPRAALGLVNRRLNTLATPLARRSAAPSLLAMNPSDR